MEHVWRWIVIGILGYIGVVLTSIDDKMAQLDLQNTEVAVLNEVNTQSFTGAEITETSLVFTPATLDFPYALAALAIAALTSIFVTWHISRVYYNQRWSKQILSRSYDFGREPIVDLRPRDILHTDQEAIHEKPLPDGRITDSWLPPKAQRLYDSWGRGNS